MSTFAPHFVFDMDDFLDNEKVLVQKYEMLLYENKAIYFDIDEFKSIAYHYITEGEFGKAMDVAMRAELCFPESAEPEMMRAMVLLDMRKINEALELLDRLENKEPLSSIINILKGRVFLEKAQAGKAILQFEAALQKEDSEGEIFMRFNISDLLMEYGEFEPALRFLL
ncbi:MAG: hypothetical protein LBC98_03195, partial [Prevotellaceae bacterium]|nr:hypothetical protein [Prevotellaceae bacterium]